MAYCTPSKALLGLGGGWKQRKKAKGRDRPDCNLSGVFAQPFPIVHRQEYLEQFLALQQLSFMPKLY